MVKRAVILHCMGQTSNGHWYPWLKTKLEARGFEVWAPDLPNTNFPSSREVVDILLASDWDFNNSLVIGHSSGSVQLMYLLANLPADIVLNAAVMVSSFDHPLPGMEQNHANLFTEELDFDIAKKHAKHRLFVHAKDDPWCPLSGPASLSHKLDAEQVILENGGHFSTSLDPKFVEFPELLDILIKHKLV